MPIARGRGAPDLAGAAAPGGSRGQDNRKGSTNTKRLGLKQLLQLGIETLMF